MPVITEDFLNKANKKFKKKNYRPWDLEPIRESTEVFENNEETIVISNENEVKKSPKNNLLVFKSEFEKEIFMRSLYGVQKNILSFLISSLDDDKKEECLTKPVYRSDIVNYTKSNVGTVGTSMFRLQEKGAIITHYHKKGKGSFSVFKVHKDIVEYFTELNISKEK